MCTAGLCYSKLDKADLAIKDLSAVLLLNPDHVSAAFARAACYNSIGQLAKAIEDYNIALLKVCMIFVCIILEVYDVIVDSYG